jgi:hypothetical protein
MALFKKRVPFPQFLAYLVSFQCDFLARSFDKLIGLADESNVLTEEDREQFFDKAHALLMVDITMRCCQYFSARVSSEEVGRGVSIVYGKYLTEHEHVPTNVAEQRIQSVVALLSLVDKAETDMAAKHAHYENIGLVSSSDIAGDANAEQLYLCSGFAELCMGQDGKSEHWEGKRFAAFKLAQGLVGGNIVATALSQYQVTFSR